MHIKKPTLAALLTVTLALVAGSSALAQKTITPPKIGEYTVGDDYFLANYTQLLEYWNKLAKQSDRIKLVEIGKTAEGRPIVMAIITSPANFKNLARYKEISQRLARAENLTDAGSPACRRRQVRSVDRWRPACHRVRQCASPVHRGI
jgi:hypothetical protein